MPDAEKHRLFLKIFSWNNST